MVWGRPDFEIAAMDAARHERVRLRVRGEVRRMAAVAGTAVAVLAAVEAAVVAVAVL